jgi:hypothetical protein
VTSHVDTLVDGHNLRLTGLERGSAYSWRLSHVHTPEIWSPVYHFTVVPATAAEASALEMPDTLTIHPYPNPTNGVVHFEVGLPERGTVNLTAYDLLGRQVAGIADGVMSAGSRTVTWNSSEVSNGVYVVRLQARGAAVNTRIVLLK